MSKRTRSKAASRKQQRQKQRQRQQMIYSTVIIAAVAVIAVMLIFLANQPLPGDLPEGVAERYTAFAETGMISTTEDGLPMLGDPDAPLSIQEYSSFTCTHCGTFHDTTFGELLADIEAGSVNFIFTPVYLGAADTGGQAANRAAFCALEQDKFWEMHDALFYWPDLYGNGASAFDSRRAVSAAGELGMDAAEFSACLSAFETRQKVQEVQDGWVAIVNSNENVTGTPTLTYNGQFVEISGGSASGGPDIDFVRRQIAAFGG